MIQVVPSNGLQVIADWEVLINAYGAHAARVMLSGDIELLIANAEGEAEWQDVTDAELVQPAGKPAKARKQ